MSLTLYQLKAFATVAKFKSFTLAAEALRVRQPSASLIVQSLERELKVKLFERLGNKIQLTNAGEELLREAELIVTRAEGLKEKIEEVKGLRKGKLTVGGSGLAAASFLPLVLQNFIKRYAGFEVILKIERSRSLEQRLVEGDIDLAILSRVPNSPLLTAEPFRDEEVVIIASPNHPLSRKRSVSLETIAKEKLVTYGKNTNVRAKIEQTFAEKKLALKPMLEVDDQYSRRDAIKCIVANGIAIGFLSKCHVASDIQAKRLSVLRVPGLQVKRTMYIVVHKNRQSHPPIQAFVNLLKDYKFEI